MEAKTNEEFFNVSALIDERFGKEGTALLVQRQLKKRLRLLYRTDYRGRKKKG